MGHSRVNILSFNWIYTRIVNQLNVLKIIDPDCDPVAQPKRTYLESCKTIFDKPEKE